MSILYHIDSVYFMYIQTGTTPLHIAASDGQLEIVKLLLKNKADANCQDNVRTYIMFMCFDVYTVCVLYIMCICIVCRIYNLSILHLCIHYIYVSCIYRRETLHSTSFKIVVPLT